MSAGEDPKENTEITGPFFAFFYSSSFRILYSEYTIYVLSFFRRVESEGDWREYGTPKGKESKG